MPATQDADQAERAVPRDVPCGKLTALGFGGVAHDRSGLSAKKMLMSSQAGWGLRSYR